MTLSFPIEPMKASMGALPAITDDANWAYEIKWDGYRTLLFIDSTQRRVRVQSSSGRDVTSTYPELAPAHEGADATTMILDGEIVVFDDAGRPTFEGVQRHERQVVFQAFDLLSLEGHDTIALPYEQRRSLLAQAFEPGPNWTVPAHHIGGGADLLAATASQGLEGVVAKRLGSSYAPGRRTPQWRKVKNRRRVEVVIGGFTVGAGNRSGTFGSLLVGQRDGEGVLRFAGGVGTGFSQVRLEQLRIRLDGDRTEACPFDPPPPREYRRDAVWVTPTLHATIEIAEFTNDGLVRHASFIDLVA